MKQIIFILLILLPLCSYSQTKINDSFDGPSIDSQYSWQSITGNFFLEDSKLSIDISQREKGEDYISLDIPYYSSMQWNADIYYTFNPTSNNHARLYVYSSDGITKEDFYIQVGTNSTRNVLLCKSTDGVEQTLIKGEAQRVTSAWGGISIKLTMEDNKTWTLYSRLSTEKEYRKEGEYISMIQNPSTNGIFRLGCKFQAKSYKNYLLSFDNVRISSLEDADPDIPNGGEGVDEDTSLLPQLVSMELYSLSSVCYFFDKPVDISSGVFSIEGLGKALSVVYMDENSKKEISAAYINSMEVGETYTISYDGLKSLDGQIMPSYSTVITISGGEDEDADSSGNLRTLEWQDIVINELLPDPFTGGSEYIELFNRSDETLSLEDLALALRKEDETLYSISPLTGYNCSIEPGGYILLSKDLTGVSSFYSLPSDANCVQLTKLPILTNTGATVVLYQISDDVVIDEVTYSPQWHSPLIKDRKGVALERISTEKESGEASNWTSAAESHGFGTPAARNSQNKETSDGSSTSIEAPEWRPETDDYIIRYLISEGGYSSRIHIYNTAGQKVAVVADQYSLATSGEILWNGTSSSGSRLGSGVYIFFVELYHPSGDVKHFKKAFVVR